MTRALRALACAFAVTAALQALPGLVNEITVAQYASPSPVDMMEKINSSKSTLRRPAFRAPACGLRSPALGHE
jgi:hypothetical protein